jgi:hypothetical protein
MSDTSCAGAGIAISHTRSLQGPLDVVFIPDFVSHVEHGWTIRGLRTFTGASLRGWNKGGAREYY